VWLRVGSVCGTSWRLIALLVPCCSGPLADWVVLPTNCQITGCSAVTLPGVDHSTWPVHCDGLSTSATCTAACDGDFVADDNMGGSPQAICYEGVWYHQGGACKFPSENTLRLNLPVKGAAAGRGAIELRRGLGASGRVLCHPCRPDSLQMCAAVVLCVHNLSCHSMQQRHASTRAHPHFLAT
jgi:hypothetical protein